ncbi:hypothetical protein D3C72_304500 [compost metagenome]
MQIQRCRIPQIAKRQNSQRRRHSPRLTRCVEFDNRTGKAITLAVYRRYVILVFPEQLAQSINAAGQRFFGGIHLGPYMVQQIILADDRPRRLQQQAQNIQLFGRDVNAISIPHQRSITLQ